MLENKAAVIYGGGAIGAAVAPVCCGRRPAASTSVTNNRLVARNEGDFI